MSSDCREFLKQECPAARILDQTARPFRVFTKKWLTSALQIYISHKSHATLTRCLGYSLLKGHAHSLQTGGKDCWERGRVGNVTFSLTHDWFLSWLPILHCNTNIMHFDLNSSIHVHLDKVICAKINRYFTKPKNVKRFTCFFKCKWSALILKVTQVPHWIIYFFDSQITLTTLQVIHCSQPCKAVSIADQSHAH